MKWKIQSTSDETVRFPFETFEKQQIFHILEFWDFFYREQQILKSDWFNPCLQNIQQSIEKYLKALMKEFDSNKNGVIEFEEFVSLLVSERYTKHWISNIITKIDKYINEYKI